MIIADTCIWSLYLRRRKIQSSPALTVFLSYLENDEIVLVGSIVQEILTGLREPELFIKLEVFLKAVPYLQTEQADHVQAASFNNVCRAKGVQASFVDSLICAMASRRNLKISQYLPIDLELIQ
jgi:predicted nucleic acid-binding protein